MSTITRTRRLTGTAMLAAVACVLQYLSFPVPMLIPSFIKMDFSELPGLLAAFAYGPLSGAAVCLIKNLVNLLIKNSGTGGIGELSNFLLGVCFCGARGPDLQVQPHPRRRAGRRAGRRGQHGRAQRGDQLLHRLSRLYRLHAHGGHHRHVPGHQSM